MQWVKDQNIKSECKKLVNRMVLMSCGQLLNYLTQL